MIQFKFQNIVDFADKLILLLILIICTSFSMTPLAQGAPKIWNKENSELKISSPLITELETNQPFYLRYTQNLSSFDLTKSIEWKIQDQNKNLIYTRTLDSNQDKNEPVKIENPGTYTINLRLKIENSLVDSNKEIKIIPKDGLYYSGLRLNEIDLLKSQVELFNNSEKDLDTSSLLINYNNSQEFNLSTLSTIPTKSYAVIELKNQINPLSKIDLVFEKNTKQSEQQIIDSFNNLSLIDQKAADKSLQFDTQDNTWKVATPSLGQNNSFESIQPAQNIKPVKGNFQKSETVRSGGFDQSILGLLPLLILFIAYILTLSLETRENATTERKLKIKHFNFFFENLNDDLFAKIQVRTQNCITWLEVFSLRAILHLQTL